MTSNLHVLLHVLSPHAEAVVKVTDATDLFHMHQLASLMQLMDFQFRLICLLLLLQWLLLQQRIYSLQHSAQQQQQQQARLWRAYTVTAVWLGTRFGNTALPDNAGSISLTELL